MLQARGLTKYYGRLCAVDHIDLDVHEGEIVGLLGPNGAGKTTALRILTGYFKPSAGTVQIKNYNLGKDLLKIKSILGYLPESIPFYRNMLVFDYLSYVAKVRKFEAKEILPRIKEIAHVCRLNEVMHKTIGQLSKGYQQRVGLAHALLHDPEILILDEPTSGLDPNQILEIRELIRKIGKKKTVLFSTHILSEAEATCDRMVIIHQGKIVANGTPEELKQHIDQVPIIKLSLKDAETSQVKSKLTQIQGIQDIKVLKEDPSKQIDLQLYCSPQTDLRETLYKSIKETDWTILEYYQQKQTLENIFKELTQEN